MSESTQNEVNNQTLPQIKENINEKVSSETPSGVQEIKNGRTYSNVFTLDNLVEARENILSSGLSLKNTKLLNIIYNRLSPAQLADFGTHILYSGKFIPSNDTASQIDMKSASTINGSVAVGVNGRVISGPVGTGDYKSDLSDSTAAGSVTNRTHFNPPTGLTSARDANIAMQDANSGGFKARSTESCEKRYDRLIKDEGQLTKGTEKAFDNKGYPKMEAQAVLNCFGKDKLCFTKEAIVDLLFLCRSVEYVDLQDNPTNKRIRVFDKNYMNSQSVSQTLTNYNNSLVSKAQTEDDLINFVARVIYSNKDNVYIFAPCTSFTTLWRDNDYVQYLYGPPYRLDVHDRPDINMTYGDWAYWINRHLNGTNYTCVGYSDSYGALHCAWGTQLVAPTFTDAAGYQAYITDTTKFTPYVQTSFTVRIADPTDEYNVQDIYSAYTYLVQRYGKYDTPYGAVNFAGSTGENVNTQMFVCPVWSRIGYLLNFMEYINKDSTTFDLVRPLVRNKAYHLARLQFGLFLNGLTKLFGSAENVSILLSNPRTSSAVNTAYKNLFSCITPIYYKSDDMMKFIYPLAKTYSANYTANLLYTLSGTYTSGTLFNNYNNANMTSPVGQSTCDLSYNIYLEDYQWWRGDVFGALNDLKLGIVRSAGSSLSYIRQSQNGEDYVELDKGYYCTQGCDSLEIDLWSDSYGKTEAKKVRCINWNATDSVVRFMQPMFFIWSGVVTSVRLSGIMANPTGNSFNPNALYASYPSWGEISATVKPNGGYSPEMDF